MRQRSKPEYSAPALEKGLDILELLSAETNALTQIQIAARLRRTASEIFRMLDVLVRRGYVKRSAEGTYEPTLRLFELAHRQSAAKRLTAAALPVMQRVSQAIRQSLHVCVHYDRRILVVAEVDSPEPMGFSVRLGSHYPFRADRASAFVLTAFQPPAEQSVLIAEMAANSPRRPALHALRMQLATVRRHGYYQAPSDVIGGVIDLSFPLFSTAPGATGALASPYLKQRDVLVSPATARAALAAAAREISASLGASTQLGGLRNQATTSRHSVANDAA
jgi:DNA-binding IclR family transcriptional regulator